MVAIGTLKQVEAGGKEAVKVSDVESHNGADCQYG